jgi:hypothetical protein
MTVSEECVRAIQPKTIKHESVGGQVAMLSQLNTHKAEFLCAIFTSSPPSEFSLFLKKEFIASQIAQQYQHRFSISITPDYVRDEELKYHHVFISYGGLNSICAGAKGRVSQNGAILVIFVKATPRNSPRLVDYDF